VTSIANASLCKISLKLDNQLLTNKTIFKMVAIRLLEF